MKKIVFSALAVAGSISLVSAQKLEDGIQALYYGKFTSATQTFQQLLQKNPKDDQAAYWLGQVYLNNRDGEADGIQKAATLYQQTASAGVNSPWILVGLGQIDYINHKNDDAEKKFDQASSTSNFKGRHKDEDRAAILTAIGRASAYGNKDIGDPIYAIPALQQAEALDKTSPEPCIYKGLNFLKIGGDQGGNAFSAFNDAITRNPKYAEGYYHMGRIFQAQDNFEIMDNWYQQGITADPTYAPIYLAYFNYWETRDASKAKGYLDKYVANSDGGCYIQYYQAEYLFRSGSYQESIAKAKEMESGTCGTYPRLPLLLAVDYHRTGDTAQAVSYAKKFFSSVAPSNIQPYDYAFAGFIYKDVPGMADTAAAYLIKAYELDTLASDKATISDSISYALDKAGKPIDKYNWDRKVYDSKDSTSDNYNLAIFNVGNDALQVASSSDSTYYAIADSFFTKYKTKYPDQIFGYKYLATSKLMQKDTTAATPYVEDYINQMLKDTSKYSVAGDIEPLYGVLAGYYINSKSDYPTGLKYLKAILAIDPNNDVAKQNADAIEAYLAKKNAPASSGGKK
ncbi:hypothetical protein A9P82_11475 [Arachidicoccus ginsenosidimutans]|uniref:tetratricopeptide repeat protein n=1 Tax=Arachidicoccus sp. BS20 TaxID=1850526 RepID=UPI0007F0F8F0|nr:tetratricopeptide repeat protein [Arachidicoccus sp. BS20]ANI89851.1 hypothetical protein A9P82_11475 [Arachidicoccus sp. BS20]